MRHLQIEIKTDEDLARARNRLEFFEDLKFALGRAHGAIIDGDMPGPDEANAIASAAAIFEGDAKDLDGAVRSAEYAAKERKREKPAPTAPRQARRSPTAAAPPATPAKKRGRPPGPKAAQATLPSTGEKAPTQSSAPGTDPHPGDRHRYDPITGRCTVGRLAALGGGECGALTPRGKGKAAEAARATPPAIDWQTMGPKKSKGIRVQVTDAAGNVSEPMSVEEAAANV